MTVEDTMKRIAEAKMTTPFGGFSVRLPYRSDLHLARKAWHMTMGLIIVSIYLSGMSRSTAVTILGSALGLDLILELSRLRVPSINEKILKIWGPFMRSHELTQLS